jgi:hypothetical protein
MSSLQTNRDLYVAIADLIGRHPSCTRILEEYLGALWDIARVHGTRPCLSLGEFVQMLSEAFTKPAPPFDEAWRSRYETDYANLPGFEGWEARVLRQLVDLREMAQAGILDDEQRYFGINSPRGQRWYNFDPCTFLECATAGFYGGWQPGDDTGRRYVPGPVMVLGDDGRLTECDPRDVAAPPAAIREVSWDDFRSFLGDGQWYE